MATNAGRLALIASQGTRATGAPALLLATAAASVGWEVGVFFTFHGVALLASTLPTVGESHDESEADQAAADEAAADDPGSADSDGGQGPHQTETGKDTRKRTSDQAYGPFGGIGWPVPEFLAGLPPAFAAMATEHLDPPPGPTALSDIEALRASAVESGVQLFACEQSMRVLGLGDADLIDALAPGGAGGFLTFSRDADVSFAF